MDNGNRCVRFENGRLIEIKDKNGKSLMTLRYHKPYGGVSVGGNRHLVEISPEYQVGVSVK